ncbi:ParA family protein [Halorubrum laminariae]|uniref:ParA family protein n=1 Tax=Halorubrum laminariae TaxID=1433523 RepID=A0ABD6BZ91_9EURY|nr:ParA family protein [Halorubrum laminariae]
MVLPLTVYNQSGGQAKSTLTRDLAGAFAEQELDVLIVDFDAQNGSVSNYLDLDEDKHNPDADDVTLHLIDQGKGPFEDLIRSVDGTQHIDVIPSHKRFNSVDDRLDDHAQYLKSGKPDGWEYPRYKRFLQILQQNDIQSEYDVILVDPNAKADEALYLALYATRNILIPAVPTRGGFESIQGVKNSTENFGDAMDITITNVGVVPTMVKKSKNIHQEYSQKIKETYPSPVYFKNLGAYEKAEDEFNTVFDHLKGQRMRDYNADIMPKFRTLAAYIAHRAGADLPNGGWDEDELFLGDGFWGEIDSSELAVKEPVTTEASQ